MPRTAITPRPLVRNGALIATTGTTTIDAALVTNGATIANAKPERTIIRCANTEASTNVLTVRAGTIGALIGRAADTAVTIAASTGIQYFGPFESDRCLQADGSISIDFEAGMTGTIEALLIPLI